MSEAQYQIVFLGALRPGFDQDQVKSNFQKKLKLSNTIIESLFSSDRVVIKRHLTADVAKQYEQSFYEQGAIVNVERQPSKVSVAGSSDIASATTPVGSNQNGASHDHPNQDDPNLDRPNQDDPSKDQIIQGEYPQTLLFEFTGKGTEYFKIWIVNIALTIVTLGIYSAWAKVRNKQYFYGNTLFEGSSFEYTAQPIAILKGRILAVMLIAIYYGINYFLSSTSSVVGFSDEQIIFYFITAIIIIGILPWVIIKALQFNARHSRYRNISFGFEGKYWGAFKTFILWPIVSVLLFFLAPFAWHRKNKFFVSNSRYGTTKFEFSATVGNYYVLFGKLFLLGIVSAGIVGGLSSLVFSSDLEGDIPSASLITGLIVTGVAYFAIYLITIAYYKVGTNNLLYNNSLLKEHSLSGNYGLGSYFVLLVTNTLGIVFTLGLFIPWAMVRAAKYHAVHTQFIASENLDSFIAGEVQNVGTFSEGLADAHSLFDIDVGI